MSNIMYSNVMYIYVTLQCNFQRFQDELKRRYINVRYITDHGRCLLGISDLLWCHGQAIDVVHHRVDCHYLSPDAAHGTRGISGILTRWLLTSRLARCRYRASSRDILFNSLIDLISDSLTFASNSKSNRRDLRVLHKVVLYLFGLQFHPLSSSAIVAILA